MSRDLPPLPPLGPIIERLEAQLAGEPGATCGLGDAEARSMLLWQRLVPPEPPPDLCRRRKRAHPVER